MKSLGATLCRPFTQCCGAPAAPRASGKDKAVDAGKADAKSDAVDVSSKRGQPVEPVSNAGLDKPRISDNSDVSTVSENSTLPPVIPADVAALVVPAAPPAVPTPAVPAAPIVPTEEPAVAAPPVIAPTNPVAPPAAAPKNDAADVPSTVPGTAPAVAGMPTPAVTDETSSFEDSSSEDTDFEDTLPEAPRHDMPALPTAGSQPTPPTSAFIS